MGSPSSPTPSHDMYVAIVIGCGGMVRGGELSFSVGHATHPPHAQRGKQKASVSARKPDHKTIDQNKSDTPYVAHGAPDGVTTGPIRRHFGERGRGGAGQRDADIMSPTPSPSLCL